MLSHACTRPECQESIAVINAKGFDYLAGSAGSVLETCELSHAYTCPVCGVRRRGSVLDTCVRAITRANLSCVLRVCWTRACVLSHAFTCPVCKECVGHVRACYHTHLLVLCVKSVLDTCVRAITRIYLSCVLRVCWTRACVLSHAFTCLCVKSVLDTCVRAITRIDLSCVTGGVSVGGCVGGGQCWTHAYHHTRSFILCVKSVLRGSLFTACVIFLFFSFPMASVWTHVCYGTQTDAHTYTHTHQPYTP